MDMKPEMFLVETLPVIMRTKNFPCATVICQALPTE
jgi:hypothetical protein